MKKNHLKPSFFSSLRFASGFSMVELMVALVIGLIVALVVSTTMGGFESRKNANTAMTEMNQSANYAMTEMEQSVRNGGSGFAQVNQDTEGVLRYFLCTLNAGKGGARILPPPAALPAPFNAINVGTATGARDFRLVPVLILPGQASGSGSDVLITMAASIGTGSAATSFAAAPDVAKLSPTSTSGFSANDLILVTRPGFDTCTVDQISSIVSTSPAAFNMGGGAHVTAVTPNIKSYCDGATTPDAAGRCHIIGLGSSSVATASNLPAFSLTGVDASSQLVSYDLLQLQNAGAVYPLAEGILTMRALYGVDTDGDGKVNLWTQATGAYTPQALMTGTPGAFCKIKAIRLGMIFRTLTQEAATTTKNPADLRLFPDVIAAGTAGYDYSATTNPVWGDRFRYRAIEATVPLQNIMQSKCYSGT